MYFLTCRCYFSFLTCRCYTGNHCHSNQLSGKLNFLQLSERHLLIKDFFQEICDCMTNLILNFQLIKKNYYQKKMVNFQDWPDRKKHGKDSRPQILQRIHLRINPYQPKSTKKSTQIHKEINPNQLRNQPKSGAAQPPSNQTFLQFNSYFLQILLH